MNQRQASRPGPLKLEDLLLRHGAITQEQLNQAQAEQKKWGGELGRTLVDLGFISEMLLMRALAHQLQVPSCDPASDPLSPEIVKALGVQICERYGVIAVDGDVSKKVIRVATSDPTNQTELRALSNTCGFKIEIATATTESITRAIRKYYYGEVGESSSPIGISPTSMALGRAPAAPRAAPETKDMLGGSAGMDAVEARLEALEQTLRPLKQKMAELMASNPHFAALTARVERLEQVAAEQLNAIRVLTDLLVQRGAISRDEFFTALQKR